MASSWAARQSLTLARLSSPRSAPQSASLIHRRGLAGAAGKSINQSLHMYTQSLYVYITIKDIFVDVYMFLFPHL